MNIRALAERFCAAPLPETVCADFIATNPGHGRTGTNLLTVDEAVAVLGYTLGAMPRAARDVLAERQRQVEEEGWDPGHDDLHDEGEMAQAAACYAMASRDPQGVPSDPSELEIFWPWGSEWWKPADPRRMLVKAAALLLAEIERLDRAAAHGLIPQVRVRTYRHPNWDGHLILKAEEETESPLDRQIAEGYLGDSSDRSLMTVEEGEMSTDDFDNLTEFDG